MNNRARLVFKIATVMAWAGVAVASAAPAEALMATAASGDYAACGSSVRFLGGNQVCTWQFWYSQSVRLTSTSCNTGDCGAYQNNLVEFEYGAGRKQAYHHTYCNGVNIYELGDCSC